MLEAEPEQSSVGGDESLSAKNARLQNKVAQLTREKKELLRKVAHYEEYTKRLSTALRKLKGSIDNLAGQSALIGEALSYSCEAENDAQNEENVPEQTQIPTKKKMQTASVLPMVRGFPIRRIIVPLQRLNINSHRHRPNRIHGHRREPWWREAEEEAAEPEPHQRVPVRRLQRVERRQHRAGVGVRPRARPGSRRRQEAAVVERSGAQSRRGGSTHQMLQAVVLLQRLSLTQHQQQQQQRREQEAQPLPAEGVRSPVVMLRDISAAGQAAERVSPKSEEPAAASVKAEPTEGSGAGPSARVEVDRAARDIFSAGPSREVRAESQSPPEDDAAPAAAGAAGDFHSDDTGAASSEKPEAGRAEAEASRELPPVLLPAEQRECLTSEEETERSEVSELPPPLSPSPPCSGKLPAEAVDGEETASRGSAQSSEAILSEMEAVPSSETGGAAGTSESGDTSVVQSEPPHLHNGDAISLGQEEMSTREESLGAPSPASADTASTEDGGALPPKSPALHNKEEPPATASTPSSSRKRKAPASEDSPDRHSGSPRSDVERDQSPHSETDQGCRPRRRCAIRKNYALFFAGWNAD